MGHNHWISFHCVLCLWVAKNDTSENYVMHCETECLFEKKVVLYIRIHYWCDAVHCEFKIKDIGKMYFRAPNSRRHECNQSIVNRQLLLVMVGEQQCTVKNKNVKKSNNKRVYISDMRSNWHIIAFDVCII